MGAKQSQPKTECGKRPLYSKNVESIAEARSKEYGRSMRIYKCWICGNLHITSNVNGRSPSKKHKNQQETSRMQRKRYKIRQKLPIETWESEGGFIPGLEAD